MSKDKRQLRAEAMERLKNNVEARFKPDEAIIAIVGGRVGQVDWSLECEKLIDLLTDDEQPETFHDDFYDCDSKCGVTAKQMADACADFNSKLPSASEWESTEKDAEQDSREKLEADIRKWLRMDKGDVHDGFDSARQSLRNRVVGYLDRQAAITEREWIDIECAKCGAMENERERDFEELQVKADELTAERDKLREKVRHQSRQLADTQNALEKRNEEIKPRWKRDTKKLQSRIDALTAERDEWRARAAEEAANAEGHRRNANNIAEECDARARALDMQLKNIHDLEHERDELRRQVSELRELNDSLHARIESAREALS